MSTGSTVARPRRVVDVATPFLNMLVYGAPGVGKTVLGATGPGPVLYLDVDRGTISVSRMPIQLQEQLDIDLNDVYFETIRGYADLKAQFETLRQQFSRDPNWYGTIILDNLTELQRVLMLDYIRKQSDQGLPKQQDWHYILLQMQWVVRNLRSLPCHNLFIAHVQEKEGVKSPALSGRIAEELPGYFDIVACYMLMEKEIMDPGTQQPRTEIQRALCCQPHPKVTAKDRSGRLGFLEPPHLGHIIDKISATAEIMKRSS